MISHQSNANADPQYHIITALGCLTWYLVAICHLSFARQLLQYQTDTLWVVAVSISLFAGTRPRRGRRPARALHVISGLPPCASLTPIHPTPAAPVPIPTTLPAAKVHCCALPSECLPPCGCHSPAWRLPFAYHPGQKAGTRRSLLSPNTEPACQLSTPIALDCLVSSTPTWASFTLHLLHTPILRIRVHLHVHAHARSSNSIDPDAFALCVDCVLCGSSTPAALAPRQPTPTCKSLAARPLSSHSLQVMRATAPKRQ